MCNSAGHSDIGHHLPFFLGICPWAEAGTYFDLLFVNLFMNIHMHTKYFVHGVNNGLRFG